MRKERDYDRIESGYIKGRERRNQREREGEIEREILGEREVCGIGMKQPALIPNGPRLRE